MNHHDYAENGRVSLFITILFAFLGITPSDLEYGLKIFLLLVSVVSGIFAIKYYWLASKEKKLQIILHKKTIEKILMRMKPQNPMRLLKYIKKNNSLILK